MRPTFLVWLQEALDPLMAWSGFVASAAGIAAIGTFRQEAYLRSELLTYVAGLGWLGILLWSWQSDADALGGALWLLCFLAGIAVVLAWYRYGIPAIDRVKARWTRRSTLVREGRTDVRNIAALLPRPRAEYDPRRYHRPDAVFLGVDQEEVPIYWQGKFPHVAVAGTTGSGKGRKLQDLAAQAIAHGEALAYLDPKADEWGPHAVYTACAERGRPYHYVELLPAAPPQLNIVEGATAWEIEELLSAALDLGDRGRASDYYKAKDRAGARHAARMAADRGLTLAEVHRQMAGDDYWQDEAPGFLDKLGELATVVAIHASSGGVSLATIIAEGGGLYVVGSMTIQAARRAQMMIFVRVQQIASARDRMQGPLRTVCVIADEAKYHISRPILQGLSASRDKSMRVVLAFQSFLDLRDCPADMDPDAVVGAIVENTPAKLVYRLEDPDTAEWLARKAGTILVDDETRLVGRNAALSETADGERSIRQSEHFLIDTNKLMNLPPGWGVFYGQGLAKPLYVSPYRVEKRREAITVVAAGGSRFDATPPGADNNVERDTRTPTPRSRKTDRDADFFEIDPR